MKHFFTKTNVIVLVLAFISGIVVFSITLNRNRSHFPNALVMKYSDFGPPSGSYQLLASEWYQWNSQGPDDSNASDDVKVVVYRNIDLATVKKTYPVFEGKSDYRYVEYSQAMDFLENQIEELKADQDRDPEYVELKRKLISDYEQTKARIIERLGP